MNTLTNEVSHVLQSMMALPHAVRQHVLARLDLIDRAISEGMMEQGTTTLEFQDLNGGLVVLTIEVRDHLAHLDISTSEEGIVVSNGYDFVTNEKGTYTVVDPELTFAKVDQSARYEDHQVTSERLEDIRRARELMRTLPMFRDLTDI